MNKPLFEIISTRLSADPNLNRDEKQFVLAACGGQDELAALLEDEAKQSAKPASESQPKAVGAYLKSVTVEGFRGVGPRFKLELTEGPGLTLVLGRNGSGKSSFAEALELLLTGENQRWSDRSQIWREGWRNLHHRGPTSISAEVSLESHQGVTVISRSWSDGANLEDNNAFFQHHGQPRRHLDELGWREALTTYRPFLSYNELGSMLEEGPSKLYDALSSILGLEELMQAQETLRQARLSRQKEQKAAKDDLIPIFRNLSTSEDERAVRCRQALGGWNLDEVERIILGGDGEATLESEIHHLRQLSTFELPSAEDKQKVVKSLREADLALAEVTGTETEQDRATAEILQKALDFHEKHGEKNCPVCQKGLLDDNWRQESEKQVAFLRERASKAEAAYQDALAATRRATSFIRPAPEFIRRAGEVGLNSTDIQNAYAKWTTPAKDATLSALADHIESSYREIRGAADTLRTRARMELERRQNLWRPLAAELGAWLPKAKTAQKNEERIPALKGAEDWLKSTSEEIRDERFEPIAERAAEVWKSLRRQSNVDLGRIELEGSGARRRVVLDVTVDGVPGVALGVMSQGELHSLALSLFIPRAAISESAFRFLVIDDPVQSMDPARVDGLARVLETCAKDRQVIVFTHDARLYEAVRRLQIDATVLEVTRRIQSVIEVRKILDPIGRYLDDARALAKTEDLPDKVAARVVPGLCRLALEMACLETIRRRRLNRGESEHEIENLIESARKLTVLTSLAFYDLRERTGDVLERLRKFGDWAVKAFQSCNSGTHTGYEGDLLALVEDAGRLAEKLRGMK